MKSTVYVETSVVSYLTAWPSRDVIVAGHQQATKNWWNSCHERFEVLASELVMREAAAGDEVAARERLAVLDRLTLLEVTDTARDLAQTLIIATAIPLKAAVDALHLAVAATNGVEYLVTWNCRHLANATMRHKIEEVCIIAGYLPPIICTPEELEESEPND